MLKMEVFVCLTVCQLKRKRYVNLDSITYRLKLQDRILIKKINFDAR